MDKRLETRALLPPDEAARYLAISSRQLRAITNEGQIPYLNIGLGGKRERRRYEVYDLEKYKGEIRCQSTKKEDKKPTGTTSKSKVSDLQEIRAALMKERPESTKTRSKMT